MDTPVTVEYFPTPQLIHTLLVEAPVTIEYLPASQSIQDIDPEFVLYLPLTHEVHGPPSNPVYPGLHEQFVKDDEPIDEDVF
jgi:hypothetical protein